MDIAIQEAETGGESGAAVRDVESTTVAAAVAPTAAESGPAGTTISTESREELTAFISTSVLPQTGKVYEKNWQLWKEFVRVETRGEDPFLTDMAEQDKAALVSLMMLRRHQSGKRGKGASAFTAAIRHWFAKTMRSTAFLDAAIIATARTSCLMKPAELRAKKDEGLSESVKLPVCEGILVDMRKRLWACDDWTDGAKKNKAAYAASMYGFEFTSRIGEYTHSEPNQVDHCARTDDFTFAVKCAGGVRNVLGSGLAALGLGDTAAARRVILECRVKTVSSKAKVVVKPKLIGRRSLEEAAFLDDLASWLIHSGNVGSDEVFSFHRQDGTVAVLTGRTVREELKKTCEVNGLPASYFSSHSLRKGGITHMRAQGSTEEDRRDRGNYAPGSLVMNNTYDYATGLGPLASNSLEGGHRLDKDDLKRLLPPGKKDV
jgi:integrase